MRRWRTISGVGSRRQNSGPGIVCGLCALLAGRRAGGGAPNESLFAAEDDRIQRDRHRRERVRQMKRIFAHYRLSLDDRGAQGLVLRTATGRSAVLADFSSLWAAADQLAGRPIDPFDPALLSHLAAGAPSRS